MNWRAEGACVGDMTGVRDTPPPEGWPASTGTCTVLRNVLSSPFGLFVPADVSAGRYLPSPPSPYTSSPALCFIPRSTRSPSLYMPSLTSHVSLPFHSSPSLHISSLALYFVPRPTRPPSPRLTSPIASHVLLASYDLPGFTHPPPPHTSSHFLPRLTHPLRLTLPPRFTRPTLPLHVLLLFSAPPPYCTPPLSSLHILPLSLTPYHPTFSSHILCSLQDLPSLLYLPHPQSHTPQQS